MGRSAAVKGGTEAVAAASNTFAAFLGWRKYKRLGNLADDAPSGLCKGFDPTKGFKTFYAFKRAFGAASKGESWHPIV